MSITPAEAKAIDSNAANWVPFSVRVVWVRMVDGEIADSIAMTRSPKDAVAAKNEAITFMADEFTKEA